MARKKVDPQDLPIPNHSLYRQMQEPHPSRQAALEAADAFFLDVQEARKKHRITEVCLTLEYGHLDENGDETRTMQCFTIGDQLKAEYLLAVALGRSQGQRERIISREISAQAAS